MIVFQTTIKNGKPYLYARCSCGQNEQVPSKTLREYLKTKRLYAISRSIKRGMRASRQAEAMRQAKGF